MRAFARIGQYLIATSDQPPTKSVDWKDAGYVATHVQLLTDTKQHPTLRNLYVAHCPDLGPDAVREVDTSVYSVLDPAYTLAWLETDLAKVNLA